MKRKVDLFFNYTIGKYQAGYAYTLELTQAEEDALTRRGCIYPSKDAKYYKEEKAEVKKVAKVTKDEEPEVETKVEAKAQEGVEENVDNKDMEQTKVQTRRAKTSKSKA